MLMRRFALLVAVLACFGSPARAHHSQAMFDQSKMVTLQGVITKFAWLNPHVQVYFDVAENGKTESWQIETNSALNMTRAGWKRDQFKAGDHVTVSFHPMRNGTRFGYLRKIVGPDGKELTLPGGIPELPGKDQKPPQ
jgi:hypothetical protein